MTSANSHNFNANIQFQGAAFNSRHCKGQPGLLSRQRTTLVFNLDTGPTCKRVKAGFQDASVDFVVML